MFSLLAAVMGFFLGGAVMEIVWRRGARKTPPLFVGGYRDAARVETDVGPGPVTHTLPNGITIEKRGSTDRRFRTTCGRCKSVFVYPLSVVNKTYDLLSCPDCGDRLVHYASNEIA